MSKGEPEYPPSAKAIDEGYNQTYLISARDNESPRDYKGGDSSINSEDERDVFFRCGNWCYKGLIQFNGLKIGLEDLPLLIPVLQKQQGSLRYTCNAKSVPAVSEYAQPILFLEEACEFIATQLISNTVEKELKKMSSIFPWINDDESQTYFELSLNSVPECMEKMSLIASKTYTRGLILISIYFEKAIYFIVQAGEGDQPLLDVRFPSVAQHGQGLHISCFAENEYWQKLTLWHVVDASHQQSPFDSISGGNQIGTRDLPRIKTINVANKHYEQTYCILKSSFDQYSPTLSVHHDVLFRFGSWCYSGRVQLTPSLNLADIPYVIPALRMQQSRLDYLCDVSAVPTTSPFAGALGYCQQISPVLGDHIAESEDTLQSLIDRLTGMGLGDSVTRWLEGDPSNSFFEFKVQPDDVLSDKFKNVELVVSKCYYASGIITITIIFQHNVYVSVLESNGENPLLDSKFPDVSGKGRGYQLQTHGEGTEDWPQLRKVSIWQTVGALEQEFKDKAVQLAEAKRLSDPNGSEKNSSNNSDSGSDVEECGDRSPSKEVSSSKLDDLDEHTGEHNPEQEGPFSTPSKAEEKESATPSSSSSKGACVDLSSASFTPTDATSARKIALPHHVPKMEGGGLQSKMDEIREKMGMEGLSAPWDLKGKPLGSIGSGMGRGLGAAPLGAIGKK